MSPEGRKQLKADEGLELEAYPDPLSPLGKACTLAGLRMRDYRLLKGGDKLAGGPWTIGYGHTGPEVHAGLAWTPDHASDVCDQDIDRHEADLDRKLPWWRSLDPVRIDVISNMAFNLGVDGLLTFKNTLASVKAGKWEDAAVRMGQSVWAGQVKGRADRLMAMMRTGARS